MVTLIVGIVAAVVVVYFVAKKVFAPKSQTVAADVAKVDAVVAKVETEVKDDVKKV